MNKCCPHCGSPRSSLYGVAVDLLSNEAVVDGVRHKVSAREAELLHIIIDCHPRVATMDHIIERIYAGHEPEDAYNTVKAFVWRLRRKLPASVVIETVQRKGHTIKRADASERKRDFNSASGIPAEVLR